MSILDEYPNRLNTIDKFIEAKNPDKQSMYFHDTNTAYSIINRVPETLIINCDSITLKHNDISIRFCMDTDIKHFDTITINGVKFKRVEENNE